MKDEGPFIVVQILTKLSDAQREELRKSGVFAVDAKIYTENPPGKTRLGKTLGYVMPADAVDQFVGKIADAVDVEEVKGPAIERGAPFDEQGTLGG